MRKPNEKAEPENSPRTKRNFAPGQSGKPKRIQRRRSKGWRMPLNAIYVGRQSKWGNPYSAGLDGTPTECVKKYRDMIAGNVWTEPTAATIKKELRGKDLACWCKPGTVCHADVLLEIANS